MLERSNDLLFANQTRATLATLEARYARRRSGGSVVLLLVAVDGSSERIAQKVWDYGKPSIAERWRAGRQAGATVVEQIRRLEAPPAGRLTVRRILAGSPGPPDMRSRVWTSGSRRAGAAPSSR